MPRPHLISIMLRDDWPVEVFSTYRYTPGATEAPLAEVPSQLTECGPAPRAPWNSVSIRLPMTSYTLMSTTSARESAKSIRVAGRKGFGTF